MYIEEVQRYIHNEVSDIFWEEFRSKFERNISIIFGYPLIYYLFIISQPGGEVFAISVHQPKIPHFSQTKSTRDQIE
jgi:hypothetical protein